MEIQQEKRNKNADKSLKPWLFQKGNPGGPGRPKGSLSVKSLVKEYLESHPEDLKEFVLHFIKDNRELAWQMMEGKPKEIGEYEIKIPKPLDELPQDLRIPENPPTPQENPGDSGRNGGQQDNLDIDLADSSGTK